MPHFKRRLRNRALYYHSSPPKDRWFPSTFRFRPQCRAQGLNASDTEWRAPNPVLGSTRDPVKTVKFTVECWTHECLRRDSRCGILVTLSDLLQPHSIDNCRSGKCHFSPRERERERKSGFSELTMEENLSKIREDEVVNVKPANIRIWIHDKDIPKLTKVLWAGQGMKLRSEISTHPRMRRFLEAVPYILNVIKDAHSACVDNDLDYLMKRTAHPVPPILLSSKDQNGLTALHKAAGLAHTRVVEYLLSVWPEAATDVDDSGKLPLHWAAAAKNNERTFNLLVQAGADETATDSKMRAAEYYRQRPQDIDRSLLTVVPEAPRIAQTVVPDFDWSIITEPSKWAGIQTRASVKKSTSLSLDANGKSTALEASRGVHDKASFSIISRNGSLSSDNVDTGSDGRTSVTTPETVEVNGFKSEGESVAIPEEEETMPGNLHEAAARTVASVAPSAIFARSAKATDASKRPPTPHYRVIEESFANGSAAARTESDANGKDEESKEGISAITTPQERLVSQPEAVSDFADTQNQLDTVEEKSLEGVEIETIPVNGEVNNNEDFGLETIKDEEVNGAAEEQQPATEEKDESPSESPSREGAQETERSDPEVRGSPGIRSHLTDDDAPAEAESMAEGDSINRVPSAEQCDDSGDTVGGDAISQAPAEGEEVGADDEELQEVTRQEMHSAISMQRVQFSHLTSTPRHSMFCPIVANNTGILNNGRESVLRFWISPCKLHSGKFMCTEMINCRGEEPPGGAMEIEGIVQGEPATGQQSEGGNRVGDENDDEPADQQQTDKIRAAIEAGDMEYLAAIVLDGQGGKLMGLETTQPEIQAFLDNVSAYMAKIRRVHLAAREGNLRDLQSALDRRKFAVAKDEISPNGATPLHVATIFGHTGIVRYLAGRFPETMSALDEQKRTPLHYAATIQDNGHFYNLLVHMGANPKALDEEGNAAEFYMMHDRAEKFLSHKQLLRNFGVQEQVADEMLNDQVPDDVHSARRLLDDADILSTLERCFKLIHDSSRTPSLAEMPARNIIPGSRTSARVTVVNNLGRYLKRNVFDAVKMRQTRLDHNLFDIIWPAMKKTHQLRLIDDDAEAGVVIPDFDCYVVFREFLVPLIKDIHCLDVSQNLRPHPTSNFFPGGLQDNAPAEVKSEESSLEPDALRDIHLNLDPSGKYIKSTLVECCRNLDVFELPLNLTVAQLEHVERILTGRLLSRDFSEAIGEESLGQYYSMNEVLENPSEIRTMLSAYGLLIPLLDAQDACQLPESLALNGQYWPYGRGVYVSASNDLVAWINCQEHLRILCSTPSTAVGDIGIAFSKIGRAVQFLDAIISFRNTYYLGNLTSRPSYLGTGLRLSYNISLPHLMKESDNLRYLCTTRCLHMTKAKANAASVFQTGMIRLSNKQSVGVTEWRLFIDFCTAVANILQLEKDLSLTNTKHIASMFVNIFRKKKHSLAETNN
ncbi:uncharacterized protein LOC132259125 [Phlebotomus argentipes]|uniref:uncharacterized protein LOC132259125 n=1 Tax=Phlebotomus argentipes TaxID=94469 RepID=UPI00289306C6|nr:uncharacterized protein LOC132259125 [Phlebotomus argentipes]